eukprot:SAG31_NODE_13865_length_841_cov_1.416442_2_plen_109_part_00
MLPIGDCISSIFSSLLSGTILSALAAIASLGLWILNILAWLLGFMQPVVTPLLMFFHPLVALFAPILSCLAALARVLRATARFLVAGPIQGFRMPPVRTVSFMYGMLR